MHFGSAGSSSGAGRGRTVFAGAPGAAPVFAGDRAAPVDRADRRGSRRVRRPSRRAALSTGALVAAVLSSGCAYHLSGRNRFLPPDLHRIAIPVFENETRRAEIEQRITESLLNEFIKRGDYQTQPQREGADAVLEGRVIGYSETPVALNAQGKESRREVVVQAFVRLTDLRTNKVLWSQEHFIFRSQYDITGQAVADSTDSGVSPPPPAGSATGIAPRSFFDRNIIAIDQIARDFAQTVVTSLLEGF